MDYKKYARVLLDNFEQKKEAEFEVFLSNFLHLVRKKNQLKLLPKIFKTLERLIEEKRKAKKTFLILRDKEEYQKILDSLKKFSGHFDLNNLEIRENKNIIGGYILKNKFFKVDNSYKKKLLELYRKIID